MAKKTKPFSLPESTIVEVVAKGNGKIFKQEMEYGKALKIKKKEGFEYHFFQKGFSSYKNVINIKNE